VHAVRGLHPAIYAHRTLALPRKKMESRAFPVNSISEEWLRLLQDGLGKEEGEVLAASLGCRVVVVNVPAGPDDEQPCCLGEITQKSSVAGNEVHGHFRWM
jgi:hypothetical protein